MKMKITEVIPAVVRFIMLAHPCFLCCYFY